MKVVLNQNVENVGKAGEVKEVADGFARNFLISNGLAEPATKENMSKANILLRQSKKQEKNELELTQGTAEGIDGKEIIIKAKAEGDKLFGSVDKAKIAEMLKEDGAQISEASIELDQPIKEIGEYPVKVNFSHGIEASIKVIIEKE